MAVSRRHTTIHSCLTPALEFACCSRTRSSRIGIRTMNLYNLLQVRAAAGKPVRVALIGAGKFGSMVLSQVPHTPGLMVPLIVDLDGDRARNECRAIGWSDERIQATTFTDDVRAIADADIDVVEIGRASCRERV